MDVVVFAALIWQVIDFLKEVTHLPATRNAVATQAAAWIGGIILVILASHAQVTQDIVLPGSDITLGAADWGSQILLGLLVSSTASSAVDVKKALDRSDTAVVPPILPTSPYVAPTPQPMPEPQPQYTSP